MCAPAQTVHLTCSQTSSVNMYGCCIKFGKILRCNDQPCINVECTYAVVSLVDIGTDPSFLPLFISLSFFLTYSW